LGSIVDGTLMSYELNQAKSDAAPLLVPAAIDFINLPSTRISVADRVGLGDASLDARNKTLQRIEINPSFAQISLPLLFSGRKKQGVAGAEEAEVELIFDEQGWRIVSLHIVPIQGLRRSILGGYDPR
jgi:hypothetical protein